MAKVELSRGRAIINEQFDGIEIILPNKKNYFLIFFLGFWLMGWIFGEVMVINALFNPNKETTHTLFMVIWLCGWTVAGGFALFIWLWNLKGKEIIRVRNEEFQYIKDFIIFSRSKEYETKYIKELRINNKPNSIFNFNASLEYWGLSGGTIAFSYGNSTHQFGSALDEVEAKNIIDRLNFTLQKS